MWKKWKESQAAFFGYADMLGLLGLLIVLDGLSHCAWWLQNSGSEAQRLKCWLRASQYEVVETDSEFKSM